MVTFEQLRITNDGQNLLVDAHVNKADYFNDVNMKRVTVCTEDQVSENHPETPGSEFIYRADIPAKDVIEETYDTVQILSEYQLWNTRSSGGFEISYDSDQRTNDYYLSIVLSGKFNFGTTNTVKLVVANEDFDPYNDSIESPDVMFIVEGEYQVEKGHGYWKFKGKGGIQNCNPIDLFLFERVPGIGNSYQTVFKPIDECCTDINFLHQLWQIYKLIPSQNQKELYTVLNKAAFDAAYINTADGEPIDATKPYATKKFEASNLSGNMFFVYVETTPVPATVPCEISGETTVGVTFDYGVIYNQGMNYTRELAQECVKPMYFTDFILNTQALKLSLETDHYIPAIKYWKTLLGIGKGSGATLYENSKPCGCHG